MTVHRVTVPGQIDPCEIRFLTSFNVPVYQILEDAVPVSVSRSLNAEPDRGGSWESVFLVRMSDRAHLFGMPEEVEGFLCEAGAELPDDFTADLAQAMRNPAEVEFFSGAM